MSSLLTPKAVWFLPRTRDKPVVSAIVLGSIIESPWEPEEAINEDKPPTIPAKLLRPGKEEPSWSWTKEFEKLRGGGLFASFLQWLGIGGEVGRKVEQRHKDSYKADRLVTTEFLPDRSYLEESLYDAAVKAAFTEGGRRAKLYMVTGLKIAYGATHATEMMNKKGLYAQLGLDSTIFGIPLTVGPKLDTSSTVKEDLSVGKSDFAFGFRLSSLRYRQGVLVAKRFDKGARYGLEDEDEGGKASELDVDAIEIEHLDNVSAKDFDTESKHILAGDEEGEEVRYFYPPQSGSK